MMLRTGNVFPIPTQETTKSIKNKLRSFTNHYHALCLITFLDNCLNFIRAVGSSYKQNFRALSSLLCPIFQQTFRASICYKWFWCTGNVFVFFSKNGFITSLCSRAKKHIWFMFNNLHLVLRMCTFSFCFQACGCRAALALRIRHQRGRTLSE